MTRPVKRSVFTEGRIEVSLRNYPTLDDVVGFVREHGRNVARTPAPAATPAPEWAPAVERPRTPVNEVLIEVEANGRTYDEMHVDGGTGAQVFVYPAAVNWDMRMERLRVDGQPRVYVIRNGRIIPEYEPVDRKIIPIATRSVSSLIRTQGVGDLYQIFALCKRDGNDFNLAFIPVSPR